MDKRHYVIGLFGAQINSINLGCQALTYSLINLLEKIETHKHVDFTYKVFERFPNNDKILRAAKRLGIADDKIVSATSARFLRIFNYRNNRKCINEIKSCDLIIDLTLGDSFSDIYGFRRFISYTSDKYVIENCRIPLILGPQTYGPFKNYFVRRAARYVIDKAASVFSRDSESANHLQELGVKKKVFVGTDLAFSLPFDRNIEPSTKKSVGINVSGMLWPKKFDTDRLESGVEMHFLCDYKKFIVSVIDELQKLGYTVHLIPHVEKDVPAIKEIRDNYSPEVICPDFFEDPISAKNYISQMDFFLGARMHSTIAAVSSGVPTIPVSYSRKFQGLYSTIGYNYCIDLNTMLTDDAIKYVLDFENDLANIKMTLEQCKEKEREISINMENEFEKQLMIQLMR